MQLLNFPILHRNFDIVISSASYHKVRDAMWEMGAIIGGVIGKTNPSLSRSALAPILRAALPLCDGIASVAFSSPVVHLGFRREGSPPRAVPYLIPDARVWERVRRAIVVDFALATGSTARAALEAIPLPDSRKVLACAVAAPEGILAVEKHHPEVPVIVGLMGDGLDGNSYILPWLTDYGKAAFGV